MTDKQQQPTEEIEPPANSVCEAFQMQLKTAAIALNAIGVAGTEIGTAAAASAGEAAETTFKQAQEYFDTATRETGKVLEAVGENPLLREFLKFFRAEGLLTLIGMVDVASAEAAVRKLQQEYPQETPAEIAHQKTSEKPLALDMGRKVAAVSTAFNISRSN
jgi:hypothetical protein